MVFENERDYVGVHNHRSGGIDGRWIHLQLDRAGVRLTKLPHQGHELFRTFRVVFGVFFQIIHAEGGKRTKPLGSLARLVAVSVLFASCGVSSIRPQDTQRCSRSITR